MSNELIPISDEQAKAVQEIAKATGQGIEAASKFISFWADVLGTVPHDLFAWLIGDRLHHARIRNMHKLYQRTEEILRQRGVKELRKVSEDIAVPLIEAAKKQDREELRELYARLLAAAMDPARTVRPSFIEAVNKLDPQDALVLQKLGEQSGAQWSPNSRDAFAVMLKVPPDQVEISFGNIYAIKCVTDGSVPSPTLTAFGRELLRALDR